MSDQRQQSYEGPERRQNAELRFGDAPIRIEGGYNFDPLRGGKERRRNSPLYEGEAA